MGIGLARSCVMAAALLLVACDQVGVGYTTAQEIIAAPDEYEGKEVKVRGVARAANKLPFVDMRTFLLAQDGADLLIVTEGLLPREGQEVALRGTVHSAAIVEGRALGLRVQEIERL